ncbi:MAG TPA: PKD domain-containing protein [Microthrixaceae bacterium]|nr:PKD domain-containing protein [Microthrixaceae bacterium]
MRRNWRTAAVVLGVMAMAAVLLPNGVGAQKVDNPGAFSMRGTGGWIVIGSVLDQDLTPSDVPQCSDTVDNDADNKIDLLDPQCAAGPNGEPASEDDNELVGGFQPKEDVTITGTIAANGALSIPASGIYFPTYYVPLKHPVNGAMATVKVKLVATSVTTGSLDPNTGAMNFSVNISAKLTGNLWGNYLPASCMIGTAANPMSIDFTTGRVPAIGSNSALNGLAYSTQTGSARVVNNSFAVPGSTGCVINNINLSPTINQSMKLPSASGQNAAVLVGQTTPVFGSAVKAAFTSSPTTGDSPLSVAFNSSTSSVKKGPATYNWDFGDGQSSTEANPSHTFTKLGVSNVTLKVIDADGDFATATKTVTVTGTNPNPTPPTARIVTTPGTPSGQAPFTVGFNGSTSTVPNGPGTYAWNFGDGTTATGVSASHTYTAAGTYTASLKVTDVNGDSNSTATTITVSSAPTEPVLPIARIGTTPTTPTGDAPFNVSFSGATSTVAEGPGTYAWTFGDGASATGVNASHVYTTPGTYTASLKVTDTTGDVSTATVTVQVNEAPVDPGDPIVPIARIVTNPTSPVGQAPFKVGFNGSTSTVDEGPGVYTWTFGDGGTATGVSVNHTYTKAGTFTATLTVKDTTGDTNSTSVSVTVSPAPVEPVSDDTIAVRFGGAFNYANSGSGLGNLKIVRDGFGIKSVSGKLDIDGTNGGTATVSVNVNRVWIFQLWSGQVSVNDAGANFSVSTPILGGIGGSKAPSTAGSTMSWFKFGGSSGIKSYSLNWSVVDAD